MDRWTGKVALVTGASAGIGAALGKELVRAGMKVVGIARRLEKLREVEAEVKDAGEGRFYPIQCDVSKPEDILRAFEWTEKELGGVDVLVNNAGVFVLESIIDGSIESFRKILDVNILAVAICTREAVQSMRKRGTQGHIININSIAGHYPESIKVPFSIYPASKSAVHAMTLSIRNEITAAKLDIRLTAISPGAVKTDMLMKSNLPEEVLEKLPMLQDKNVVDAVIYALSAPAHVNVNELQIVPHEVFLKMENINERQD